MKLASYTNLLGYGPYTLGFLYYLLAGENAAFMLSLGMNWSLFGQWFLNFYVLYVSFYNALASFSANKLIVAIVYLGYSTGMMVTQFALIPGVNDYIKGSNYNAGRFEYESPEQDRKEITDFTALESSEFITNEEAATEGFPTSEEDAEIQAIIQASIDADERPASAKDFSAPENLIQL